MNANTYSTAWFETFLAGYSPTQTETEIEFLIRQLPLPIYRRVLDVCCGSGRHSLPLAECGYHLTGIDFNDEIIRVARHRANGQVSFISGDMRNLAVIPGQFDAVICLWQSFGYFDEITNAHVLRQMRDRLRRGGRVVLDIYHREFFIAHQGQQHFEKAGMHITEDKWMNGDYLTVTLDYGAELLPDVFTWQLYTPAEIIALGAELELHPILACTGFDENKPATADSPRMQLVFERN
jgi:SAM-dependent methyltransferase